jgi:hypothetical protein
VDLGGNGAPSWVGVDGVESLTAMVESLRFSDALAPRATFAIGVSGAAGAASSRARALVDRRGSDMSCGQVIASCDIDGWLELRLAANWRTRWRVR